MIELFMEKPWVFLGVAFIAIPLIAFCIASIIITIENHFSEKRIKAISERYRIKREKDEKEHKEFMRQYSFDAVSKK